ncbi:hypothetical protein BGZ54_001201, partial [Gamsiella multidivaricata]
MSNYNKNKDGGIGQDAAKYDPGLQRAYNSREDSSMRSDLPEFIDRRSSPMRVSALRPENQEFKVAGEDYGGAMRQKAQPSLPQ